MKGYIEDVKTMFTLLIYILVLLGAPSEVGELESFTKAKNFYKSCMDVGYKIFIYIQIYIHIHIYIYIYM